MKFIDIIWSCTIHLWSTLVFAFHKAAKKLFVCTILGKSLGKMLYFFLKLDFMIFTFIQIVDNLLCLQQTIEILKWLYLGYVITTWTCGAETSRKFYKDILQERHKRPGQTEHRREPRCFSTGWLYSETFQVYILSFLLEAKLLCN